MAAEMKLEGMGPDEQEQQTWRGKVAVVTGASSGIGAEIAVALANQGVTVVGLARRQDRIEELRARVEAGRGGIIHALKCDVTVEADVRAAFDWTRAHCPAGVDLFVNNAGMMTAGFLTDNGTAGFMDRYRSVLDLNVTAALVCTREAIQLMTADDARASGHIILMNSILGHRIPDVPVPMFNVYPATKYALSALAQVFRQEMRHQKRPIKITSISPAMVDTDMIRGVFRAETTGALPKLTAQDVAAAVLYAINTPPGVQINEIILEAIHVPSRSSSTS